jgi:hypothetical protein
MVLLKKEKRGFEQGVGQGAGVRGKGATTTTDVKTRLAILGRPGR